MTRIGGEIYGSSGSPASADAPIPAPGRRAETRQGGAEAAQAVKSWCHEERRIERLVSLIAPDNVRSQRVAEKLGACRGERIETAVGPTDVWAYLR